MPTPLPETVGAVPRLLAAADRWVRALFDYELERQTRPLAWLWLAGLYAAGVLLWAKFLNFGRIPFELEDWAEVTAPRLALLRDALVRGIWPLHSADMTGLRGITDRIFTIPDLILSPQVVLLRWLEVGPFILVNTLLLFSIGMLGLLWIRRRYRISLFAFAVLFFLFNFNGHILAHMAVGHANWAGYFLFPWLAVQVFRLLDRPAGKTTGWGWAAQTALLFFFLFLQGAFHQYAWGLMLLGLIALTSWRTFLPVVKAGVFAVLLSLVRILPAALVAGAYDSDFLGGYTSLNQVFQALLASRGPEAALRSSLPLSSLAWWEFDLFIGVLGTAFLLYFGLYRWLRNRREEGSYPELLLPLTVLAALSVGNLYQLVQMLSIPLFSGERVASRILSLPLVFLLILGAIELQRWLRSRKPSAAAGLALIVVLLLMVQDLWLHIRQWQVTSAVAHLTQQAVDLSLRHVQNRPDAPYTNLLIIGAVATFISLGVLLFLWRRSRRERAD